MATLSPAQSRRLLFWLVVTTAAYLLMNGAQIFETALIVPAWTAAPPASLRLFQGEHRLDFKVFWITFHSLHELTFVAALVSAWRVKELRSWLLPPFVVHLAVRVWTLAYFAPTIIELQGMPTSPTVDPALAQRAAQWRALNYVRVALFLAVNLALFPPLLRAGRLAFGPAQGRGGAA